MKVFKIILPNHGAHTVEMHYPAKVISVANQREKPVAYVEVNETGPKRPVKFRVVMTGEEIRNVNMKFIGTVVLHGGDYVVHIYQDFVLP